MKTKEEIMEMTPEEHAEEAIKFAESNMLSPTPESDLIDNK